MKKKLLGGAFWKRVAFGSICRRPIFRWWKFVKEHQSVDFPTSRFHHVSRWKYLRTNPPIKKIKEWRCRTCSNEASHFQPLYIAPAGLPKKANPSVLSATLISREGSYPHGLWPWPRHQRSVSSPWSFQRPKRKGWRWWIFVKWFLRGYFFVDGQPLAI